VLIGFPACGFAFAEPSAGFEIVETVLSVVVIVVVLLFMALIATPELQTFIF
jgi:hypothetical protein